MSATTPGVSRESVIVAFEDVWGSIAGLLDELSETDLARPTPCTKWSVRDIVAHMIGTESTLLAEPAPDLDLSPFLTVRMSDDARENEQWLAALRLVSPPELRRLFRDCTSRRLAALSAMTDHAWTNHYVTLGPVEGMLYPHLMIVRVLDCWMHEQDIRDATRRPGHEWGPAAAATVDAICHLSGATPISSGPRPPKAVIIELTASGRVVRRFGIVGVNPENLESTTTTVTMAAGAWTRLCGGRRHFLALSDEIAITGSRELAMRTLEQLRNEW